MIEKWNLNEANIHLMCILLVLYTAIMKNVNNVPLITSSLVQICVNVLGREKEFGFSSKLEDLTQSDICAKQENVWTFQPKSHILDCDS